MTESLREYYASRTPFEPHSGETYLNINGITYLCKCGRGLGEAVMQNPRSGWTFIAKGIGMYADGRIDWDHSTGGAFETVEQGREPQESNPQPATRPALSDLK